MEVDESASEVVYCPSETACSLDFVPTHQHPDNAMVDMQQAHWYRSWPGIVLLIAIVLILVALAYTFTTQEPGDNVGTPDERYELPLEE